MRVTMFVILHMKKSAPLFKKLDDLGVRREDILSCKEFHIRCEPAGRIEGGDAMGQYRRITR